MGLKKLLKGSYWVETVMEVAQAKKLLYTMAVTFKLILVGT